MPLPREVLESVAEDIREAEGALAELKDVVADLRLAGFDTTNEEDEITVQVDELRKLKVFHDRQQAKQT